MNIVWERQEEAAVARLEGRVDGSNAQDFQGALESGLDPDARVVVLDCERLAFISSAGLRVFLMLAKQLRERGARIGLCSLSAAVFEVFAISGFEKVIPIYASRAEAMGAFGEARKVDDAEVENLRSSVDFEIVGDNVKDIAALSLEKYEYLNDRTLSDEAREKALKQIEDALWQYIEQLKRRRLEVLREMFRLASRTLDDVVGGAAD